MDWPFEDPPVIEADLDRISRRREADVRRKRYVARHVEDISCLAARAAGGKQERLYHRLAIWQLTS